MNPKLLIALLTGSCIVLGGMSTFGQERPPGKRFPGKPPSNSPPPAVNPRTPDRLKVGMPAPDFKLKIKEGGREVQLSTFRGKRPVILVFGSYT